MHQTADKFGLGKEMPLPVSLGMDEKGDEDEFTKYIAIIPLYPNAALEKGKWVILKCDSALVH